MRLQARRQLHSIGQGLGGRPGSVPIAPTSAQERKKSGRQPLQIDGCGGQIGLNTHVREAAPDSAGKSMPSFCLAMEAFRAPTMPLIEPSILLAPSITAASRPK